MAPGVKPLRGREKEPLDSVLPVTTVMLSEREMRVSVEPLVM